MLALATGWHPRRVIDRLPARFRSACHWALYVRALVGDEGFPVLPALKDVAMKDKGRVAEAAQHNDNLRTLIYPEDDGG